MSEPTSEERPLLVLEHVERDPSVASRLIGTVRLAGHAQRVVVDVGNPLGLLEYVDIPLLLGAHDPSLAAVVEAMSRWHDGEELGFPLDLSQRVRDTAPPVPIQPLSANDRDLLDAEADRVDLVLLDVERSLAGPSTLRASLVLAGAPVTVEVEIPGTTDEGVMRWIVGPPTATFSRSELHAIYRALLPYAPDRKA